MNVSRFRFLSLISMVLLTFVSVTNAYAAKPDVVTFVEEGSFEIDCGSFVAVSEFVQEGRVTFYYDQFGDLVKVEVHINYDGTITNSVTNKTVRDPGHFKIVFDPQTGTQAFIGVVYAITVPGEGIVVLDAGKVVFDGDAVPENVIFEAGQYTVLYEGEAVICNALD